MSQKKSISTRTRSTPTSSATPGARKRPSQRALRDALVRIETLNAEAIRSLRDRLSGYLSSALDKVEDLQRSLSTANIRCAELATHVRRLTDEKAQLGAALAKKDRELDDFRQSINRGLEREADLKGRLIGVIAGKVEHFNLADPRLQIPVDLIDYGKHSLSDVERHHNG